MSNNTTVSGITKPTEYTLLDTGERKYLPRKFTFVPTVSSDSSVDNITETVKNALNNNYYTCTPQDFVYKIDVNKDLKDVVYKVDNQSACVYKISSEGNDVYKYCESNEVDINVLGGANINIGNVTVKKGEDVLKPIAANLGCTKPDATKEITVPKDYDSLKINSSDVYFRQESSSENPSWVTISNSIVSFSSDIKPSENIINFFDNNFTITLNKNTYSFNSMIDINLMNAYDNLTLNEPQLNLVAINLTLALRKAVTDLEQATTDLKQTSTNSEQATTNLEQAATDLEQAATNLEQVVTDLGKAATNLEQVVTNLEQVVTNLEQVVTDLGKAATDLGKAATDLKQAATDLKQAATDLKQAATDSGQVAQHFQNASLEILNTSLSLKQYKLFDEVEENNNTTYVWKNKNEDITDIDTYPLTTITTNFKECQEGVKGNEFNQYFDGLKAIYAIYNNDDNIGLMDTLKKCVVVNNTPVLKGILEKCFTINNPFENIKMFALDINNEMIIYKKNENTYELVYRDPLNTESILSKNDSFLTTTNSAEP